jgi:hypothetical protein
MVKNEKEHRKKKPARQAFQEPPSEPSLKIPTFKRCPWPKGFMLTGTTLCYGHGLAEPSSMGRPASRMCFRLSNTSENIGPLIRKRCLCLGSLGAAIALGAAAEDNRRHIAGVIADWVRRIRCPVLFIHGKADWHVLPEHSIRLFGAIPSRKDLWLVEGVGHTQAFFRHAHECVRRVNEFLEHPRG